jgi:hypothetical protein
VSPEQRDLPEWRRAAERAKSRWAAAKNFRPEPADSKSWNGQYEAVRRSERSGTRLALSLDEAAAALGVSRAFFQHVHRARAAAGPSGSPEAGGRSRAQSVAGELGARSPGRRQKVSVETVTLEAELASPRASLSAAQVAAVLGPGRARFTAKPALPACARSQSVGTAASGLRRSKRSRPSAGARCVRGGQRNHRSTSQ